MLGSKIGACAHSHQKVAPNAVWNQIEPESLSYGKSKVQVKQETLLGYIYLVNASWYDKVAIKRYGVIDVLAESFSVATTCLKH